MNRIGAVVIVALLAAGACSSSATVAPVATVAVAVTPQPSPAPSPTPTDVAGAFLARVRATTTAAFTITGATTLGAQTGGVTGSLRYAGHDVEQTLVVSAGGVTSTTSTIRIADAGYTKVGDGPWLRDRSAPLPGGDLATVLTGLSGLADVGIEVHDGEPAHRLELPAGVAVAASAFGLNALATIGPSVRPTFFAADDGTPLAVSLTATGTRVVAGHSTPVAIGLDFQYAEVDGTVRVGTPVGIWHRFSSTRYRYGLAYPDGWHATTTLTGLDRFDGPGHDFFTANRRPFAATDLDAFVADEIREYVTNFHWTFTADVAITLGGARARLVTFHGTIAGRRDTIFEVFCLRGGYAYDLTWKSPQGHVAVDLSSFRRILATFAFS